MKTISSCSPYVTIERSQWKRMRERKKIELTEEQLDKMRGLNEFLSMQEVRDIYAPLSRLIKVYYENYLHLNQKRKTFLGLGNEKIPYIIGMAGSVAVGKSTTARIIKELASMWPEKPSVYIVTTDGFLYSNRELESRGIMSRKGFPESYDLRSMINFLYGVKSGIRSIEIPQYSHLIYDITEEKRLIEDPDIIIFEGLNVLQTHTKKLSATGPDLMVSDFFDFSIYVDADEEIIKKWFMERFLKLKATAFKDPKSYFRKFAEIDEQEAIIHASYIWDEINGRNLKENIIGTKYHAQLIMKKTTNHMVDKILLRKI